MTNDFSNISAESNLRDEIAVRSDEYDPVANPAYEGPMGIFTDYEGCDTDPTVEGESLEDEGTVTEPDDSMDGDFDSGMASAGHGTDEDYGYYGDGED